MQQNLKYDHRQNIGLQKVMKKECVYIFQSRSYNLFNFRVCQQVSVLSIDPNYFTTRKFYGDGLSCVTQDHSLVVK